MSSLKIIGFLHFLKLLGLVENNYLWQSFWITLYIWKKSQRAESICCCQELSYVYLSLGSCPSGYTLESGGTKCYILRFPTSVSEVKNWEMIDNLLRTGHISWSDASSRSDISLKFICPVNTEEDISENIWDSVFTCPVNTGGEI